jgi:hypothetical protein
VLVVFAQSARTVTVCLHELSHSLWTATACTYWLATYTNCHCLSARTATCSTSSQTALAATVWLNCYSSREFAVHTNCKNWQSQHSHMLYELSDCMTCHWLRYRSIYELVPCARTVTVCTNHDSLPELTTWKKCHCLREPPQPTETAPSWPVRHNCD